MSPDGPLEAELTATPQDMTHGTVIHRIAARRVIREVEDADDRARYEMAVDLGVRYSLASRFTSFVGVDASGDIVESSSIDHRRQQEDKLARIQQQVDQVKSICNDSISALLERSERLDSLADRDLLHAQAYTFKSNASALRRRHSALGRVSAAASSAAASVGGAVNRAGDALSGFFQSIFSSANEETKRAMVKSYSESGGTVLSTNWDDVAAHATVADVTRVSDDKVGPDENGRDKSAKAQSLDASATLAQLVTLQLFDGSWAFEQALCDLIGVQREVLEAACPITGCSLGLWGTALGLALLRGPLRILRTDWEMVGDKAVAWLGQALRDGGHTETVDDLVEKACRVAGF